MSHYNRHVFICTNQKAAGKQCCATAGAEISFAHIKSKLLELNMAGPGKTRISKSGCLGRCSLGPCIVVYPEGVWYHYDSIADIDEIIQNHLVNNTVVQSLLIEDL